MAFIDHRISDRVSQGFQGGPVWDTTVVPNSGGQAMFVKNWSRPHWKFNADYAGFPEGERNDIYNTFLCAGGRVDSFRFKDHNDFTAVDQPLGTGDGTATPRQLRKYYTLGKPVVVRTFTRDIILPRANTVVVTDNGAPFAVTVNDQTGMVTPVSGNWISGHIYKASFQFDVRVRFLSDFYAFTLAARGVSSVAVDLEEAITP